MKTKAHHRAIMAIFLIAVLMLYAAPSAIADPSLEEDIATLARMGDNATAESIRALADKVKKDQSNAFEIASRGLSRKDITQEEKVLYVWTLGLTGKKEAARLIIRQLEENSPTPLRATAESALAELGGDDAGKYLMARFKQAGTDEYKAHMLNLVSQFHYAPALDSAEYLLMTSPDNTDWESVFVFTKMGKAAVPWLIKKLDSPTRSIRLNAVMLLGQWIAAPAASKPLMKLYEKEKEPQARELILDAIERTTYDLSALEKFMMSAADKETDQKVRDFAFKSAANTPRMKEAIEGKRAKMKPDRKRFDEEYAVLHASKGTKGSIAVLAESASVNDIERLIELREQVLRRRSEAALSDVQEINRAILIQRFLRGR